MRITTFDAGHSKDEIPDYGVGTGNVEVFIDGNEVTGQSRMRVGNAVWHDGYEEAEEKFTDVEMDGVDVVTESEIGPATLLAVGSSLGSVKGAPTEDQAMDPVPEHHSGLIVIRSKREVRMDDGSKLRIGVPSKSIYINADLPKTCVVGTKVGRSVLTRPKFQKQEHTYSRPALTNLQACSNLTIFSELLFSVRA